MDATLQKTGTQAQADEALWRLVTENTDVIKQLSRQLKELKQRMDCMQDILKSKGWILH
jgi:uncharacterized coiled-coil protein SlyX